MTEMIEELPKGQGWKTAIQVWEYGSEPLLVFMEEIFEMDPPIQYKDANGLPQPLVQRFRNGTRVAYYMKDTAESLKAMGGYLLKCAESDPDRMVSVDMGKNKRDISLQEYVQKYHHACLIPDLPENEGWKTAIQVWGYGSEPLLAFMEEIFEMDPPVQYEDANGLPQSLVQRFRNGAQVACYMKDTAESLEAMGAYLEGCAESDPDRIVSVDTGEDKRDISLQEYVRLYHHACLVPDLPEDEGLKTAWQVWGYGYEALLVFMEEIFEMDPLVQYEDANGLPQPLVQRFRNGARVAYYMKDTAESLEAMGTYLEGCAESDPQKKIRIGYGKNKRDISLQEYVRLYRCACLVPDLPEDEGWKTAWQVWSNGQKYGFGKILEWGYQEDWKDVNKEPLVQCFRNSSQITYYMKDTPESLSAMHEKMMMLAIFDPEYFGGDLDLRKVVKAFTKFLTKNDLGMNVSCPKDERDWEKAYDSWMEDVQKQFPSVPKAEGLRKLIIQQGFGIDFPLETVEKWVPVEPINLTQRVQAFYQANPGLREWK